MDKYQHETHTYPMKKYAQYLNIFLGFFAWVGVYIYIIPIPFIPSISKWTKKVKPAFRKIMAGGSHSYLRVSNDGLVYRNWPWFEMHCKWEDVNRINKAHWFGDTLFLQRADQIGHPEFSINLGPPKIHLSSLVGWEKGGLKDDLRQYAPQLFLNQL